MDNSYYKKYILIATYTVLLYLLFTNLSLVLDFVVDMLDLLNPVIIGIAIAFLLNIILKFFEERLFVRLNKYNNAVWNKLKRPLLVVFTYLTSILILVILAWFIVPQLFASISVLTSSIPDYIESFKTVIENLIVKYQLEGDLWNKITINWKEIVQRLGELLSNSVPYILTFTKNFTASFLDLIMGIMLSIYILLSKEKLILICKKLVYAYLPKNKADKTVEIGVLTNKAFSGFIAGQSTEALIIGVLCFVGMSIFSMPYAFLISVIVAVTSIVPILGAYIGTIPSTFIILMIDPPKAFWFVIFIIVLQQIEGNFIYPRVVGNSIGLSGLWVLLALIIGGSLFGLMGMILGIPAFAVIYSIVRSATNRRLNKRNIKV